MASNATFYPELTTMCHQFYALGQRITDHIALEGISNTVLNGVCTSVKTDRGGRVNTVHTAILTDLAGL